MEENLARRVQLSSPGNMVELFDLDLSPVDPLASTLYFYPGSNENQTLGEVTWRGNDYRPQPIKIDGIEVSGVGSLPRPRLSMSNLFGQVADLIDTYGRLDGAVLRRWQTFDLYLDGGTSPNPDGHLPIDEFVLDRLVTRNRREVVYECRSHMDIANKQVPARLVLQGTCLHTYRRWDPLTETFDYTNVTCPYGESVQDTGTFNRLDQPSSPADDDCSRKLRGCRLRFGNRPLPTRAFPGVGRYTA